MTDTSNRPVVDLPLEQRRIRLASAKAFALCAVISAALIYWLPLKFDLPMDPAQRLAFALRADIFVALWILVGVQLVARTRFRSAEDNAGSAFAPPSARLAIPAAFLQNTLEQASIAIVGHLALTTVSGEAPLAFIVASVILFALGRIAFLRGYPQGAGGRAFGMATTALPALGAYVWVIWDVGAQAMRAVA